MAELGSKLSMKKKQLSIKASTHTSVAVPSFSAKYIGSEINDNNISQKYEKMEKMGSRRAMGSGLFGGKFDSASPSFTLNQNLSKNPSNANFSSKERGKSVLTTSFSTSSNVTKAVKKVAELFTAEMVQVKIKI